VVQSIEFVVYPDSNMVPPVDGELLDLDAVTAWPKSLSLQAGGYLTVRLSEFNSANGFAWEMPQHNFTCLDIVDENFGGFQTGFKQILFKAKTGLTAACTEDVPMARPSWWASGTSQTEFVIVTVAVGGSTGNCTDTAKPHWDGNACSAIPVR
jgi:hypothetical protein